mgnify:CR=1 FL=1
MTADQQKRAAAQKALDYVRSGMRLGLGTGSTAAHFVDLLGARVKDGLDIVGVPTSEATRRQAEGLGIKLTTLDETPQLDLTVDGADEIGPGLILIKGAGGAHLREKIVAAASAQMLVIADASKHVASLGGCPLPLEIVRFGTRAVVLAVEKEIRAIGLDGAIMQRKAKDGSMFVSDNGNYVFDCQVRSIPDPAQLARTLEAVPGLVEHGLFIGLAGIAVVAGPEGVQVLER